MPVVQSTMAGVGEIVLREEQASEVSETFLEVTRKRSNSSRKVRPGTWLAPHAAKVLLFAVPWGPRPLTRQPFLARGTHARVTQRASHEETARSSVLCFICRGVAASFRTRKRGGRRRSVSGSRSPGEPSGFSAGFPGPGAFRPLSRGPRRAGSRHTPSLPAGGDWPSGAFSSCCWAFMLPQRYRLAGDSPREAKREMLLTVTRSAGFHGRAPARRGFSTWKESRHLVTGLGRGRARATSSRHSGQTPRMNRPQLLSRCLVSAARAVPGPGGGSGPGGGAMSIHPGPGGWGGGVILMTPPQM